MTTVSNDVLAVGVAMVMVGFVIALGASIASVRCEKTIVRMAVRLGGFWRTRPSRMLRMLRVQHGGLVWVTGWLLVILPVTAEPGGPRGPVQAPSWFLTAALVWLGGTAVFAALAFVVARTARPRLLVIPQCRDMSLDETDEWLLDRFSRGESQEARTTGAASA